MKFCKLCCMILILGTFLQFVSYKNHQESVEISKSEEVVVKATSSQEQETVHTNYLQDMIDCCIKGDRESGLKAECLRNDKIDNESLDYVKISYEDLWLLSKIITWEAGSSWLSDEHQLLVGNVVLNRVGSPEFPNTVYDVLYQKGQYEGIRSSKFNQMLPSARAVNNAALLLSGNRYCPKSVVFQSNFKQGSGTYKVIKDKILGNTYFCYSYYPNKY